MAQQKQCPIGISPETYDKIKFLATQKNQSMAAFVKEFVDAVFEIGFKFPNGCNVEYETSVLNNTLTLRFSGKSVMIVGAGETELERLQNKVRMQNQVKRDIAKAFKKIEIEELTKEKLGKK